MHINACRLSKENMPNRSTAGKGCPVTICRGCGQRYQLSLASLADDCSVAGPQSPSLIDKTIACLCARTHSFAEVQTAIELERTSATGGAPAAWT
jgi:hypothetical protein